MNLMELDLKHIWHPCTQMKDCEVFPPIVAERAKGAWIYDSHGRPILDVISSRWCNLLGHCHPNVVAAVTSQLAQMEHVIFANFTHRPAVELCETLAPLLPPGLVRFNFSDSGSAAVECALKMSFQYQAQTGQSERTQFLCLFGGYHGETLGALSVGAVDLYSRLYKPLLFDAGRIEAPDCYRCPWEQHRDSCDVACLKRAEEVFERHGATTAALIVEPLLQGSAGMKIYPPRYLLGLRELCDAWGVLLIADEIATGFGRTGTLFACEQAGISPDIVCLSKGLTGGTLPMALTVTTDAIYQAFYDDYGAGKAFMHSHYSGTSLGCAAALAVLRTLKEESILDQSALRAQYFYEALTEELGTHRHVGEIRHLGLINAIELVENRHTKAPLPSGNRTGWHIFRYAIEQGLLLRPLGDVIYFNPPLTINKEELDFAVKTSAKAIRHILN